MNRRLYRSSTDRKIGGVAAGTAEYFDVDPSIARVIWLLLAIFTGGAFVIVYLVMWAIVPEAPWSPPVVGAAPTAGEGSTDEDRAAMAAGAAAGVAADAEAEGQGAAEGAADAPTEPGTPSTPWAPTTPQPSSTWSASAEVGSGPGPHVILGAILILVGGWFLVDQFFPGFSFGTLWPIGLVAIGVIILVAALRRGG
jgi:phage shock protein PspC (stress-responsive transcriptional regulator)